MIDITDPQLARIEEAVEWNRRLAHQTDAATEAAFGAWLRETPENLFELVRQAALDEVIRRTKAFKRHAVDEWVAIALAAPPPE